jgi:hypothetical protein
VVKRETARPAQQPAAKRAPSANEEKRPKEDLETRRTKAVEIAVQTFDALASERGDSGKIWASVLKNAIKRRKPDFNETYYGFRAFGNLLEEAQARGLLEFGRDEKSGAYVYRSATASVSEQREATHESRHEAHQDAPREAPQEAAPSEAAVTAESASKQHDSRRRGRGNRKGAREAAEPPRTPESSDSDAQPRWTSAFASSEPEDERDHEAPVIEAQPSIFEIEEAVEETAGQAVVPQAAAIDSEASEGSQETRRKGRGSRKTTARKAARKTAATPAEAATEADAEAAHAAPVQEAPAQATPEEPVARKTARKSTTRARRPRKAAATSDAE